MTLVRVPRTRPATLAHVFYVDETGTDAAGPVAVVVTDATGEEVAAGTATSVGSGRYTFALGGQADVAELTVAWTGTLAGATVTETDTVEIVGAHLFDLASARAADSSLASTSTYPTADLVVRRLETEVELEHITDTAWTRRYARVVLNGTGVEALVLGHPDPDRTARDVRVIRSASIAATTGGTPVTLTPSQLAALAIRPDGSLRRTDGLTWTEGSANVVIEYEYGRDSPPPTLVRAMYIRLRYRAQQHRSGIPDRAESYTAADGSVYRLGAPGPYATGMPEVDGVYSRYSARPDPEAAGGMSGRGAPASRTLTYRPQRNSIFH